MVPGATYYRMSSDQQEESIAQQRKEVMELAAREGYQIIREYVDEGKSGSKQTDRRTQFLQMLRDSDRKEFQAVLVWKTDRFSREDPGESYEHKKILKRNGVFIHSVKEGKITWDSQVDWIKDVVQQTTANEYSKNLSELTVRGRRAALAAGINPNGCIPLGYDRQYSDGSKTIFVKRKEKFAKPRGWKRQLVINDSEAAIVRFVYKEFLERDGSIMGIARKITEQGYARPDGSHGDWTFDAVRDILRNKIYAGYVQSGGAQRGRLMSKDAFNRIGSHEIAGGCPAIIDLADWERAKIKLDKNREEHRKIRPAGASPLSGSMICGHCGFRMSFKTKGTYRYFSCDSPSKRPNLGCHQWTIQERDVLPLVISELVKTIDRHFLEAYHAKPTQEASPLESLKASLETLQQDLAKGREKYLRAPEDLLAGLQATLKEWTQREEELRRRIENLSRTDGKIADWQKWWQEVRGQLVQVLPYELGVKESPYEPGLVDVVVTKQPVNVEYDRFRQLLRELHFDVTVFWRSVGKRWKPERIQIGTQIHSVDALNIKCLHSVISLAS